MIIQHVKGAHKIPAEIVRWVIVLSFISLAACQTTPRTGTYPAANAKPQDIQECNVVAANAAPHNSTTETVKDAAIGGAGGAGVGAVGGAIGGNAGKGAAIGAAVGAVAGTLYGINEGRKQDQTYQNAYRSCMQQRGY